MAICADGPSYIIEALIEPNAWNAWIGYVDLDEAASACSWRHALCIDDLYVGSGDDGGPRTSTGRGTFDVLNLQGLPPLVVVDGDGGSSTRTLSGAIEAVEPFNESEPFSGVRVGVRKVDGEHVDVDVGALARTHGAAVQFECLLWIRQRLPYPNAAHRVLAQQPLHVLVTLSDAVPGDAVTGSAEVAVPDLHAAKEGDARSQTRIGLGALDLIHHHFAAAFVANGQSHIGARLRTATVNRADVHVRRVTELTGGGTGDY